MDCWGEEGKEGKARDGKAERKEGRKEGRKISMKARPNLPTAQDMRRGNDHSGDVCRR